MLRKKGDEAQTHVNAVRRCLDPVAQHLLAGVGTGAACNKLGQAKAIFRRCRIDRDELLIYFDCFLWQLLLPEGVGSQLEQRPVQRVLGQSGLDFGQGFGEILAAKSLLCQHLIGDDIGLVFR